MRAPDWWLQTIQDLGKAYAVWDNHPLAGHIFLALIDYIEEKAFTCPVTGIGP